MKHYYSVLAAFGLLACVSTSALAQYPAEFTKDQADSTIGFRRTEISNLQSDIARTQSENTKAMADVEQRTSDVRRCQESLYSMLGSDRNGYLAFRERLGKAENDFNRMKSMGSATQPDQLASMEATIRAFRDNKLALIPDHYRRVLTLSQSFTNYRRGLVPPNTMYTVGTWRKDRDCLWNIAKKPDIYNDAFAWPKIWRANMDQIKNPDVIHPGQQLTIAKTPVTEEDRDVTGYRHRRAR